MVSLLPRAVTGGFFGSAFASSRKHQSERLVEILLDKSTNADASAKLVAYPSHAQRLFQAVTAQLASVDERYQRFVQEHIDPLLGKTRHGQLQEMLGQKPPPLRRDERLANRRFAMGMASLTFSLVGQWLFPPLIPLAIGVGLLGSSAAYLYAYEQWKKTKRLGAIHLLCVYSLYLWLGGSLAMLNYLNLAARSGILVKNAHALEQLGAIDTMVFDKTGTLTLEQPHIAQIHTFTRIDAEAVLRFAAAAERNLQLPAIDQAHYEVGYGIKVRLADDDIVTRRQDERVNSGDSLTPSPSPPSFAWAVGVL